MVRIVPNSGATPWPLHAVGDPAALHRRSDIVGTVTAVQWIDRPDLRFSAWGYATSSGSSYPASEPVAAKGTAPAGSLLA